MIYNISKLLEEFLVDNNVEFTFGTSWDTKVLFTFFSDIKKNHHKVYSFLSSSNQYFLQHKKKLQLIFMLADKYQLPIHISFNIKKKQTRIYLWLYYQDIQIAKKITLYIMKNLYSYSWSYRFEDTLYRIDCLGFNINENLEIKVYELVPVSKIFTSCDFFPYKDVKEYGFLKDMKWRKKEFFRFSQPLGYIPFLDIFSQTSFDALDSEISNVYALQRKVKYYCLEWDKKEIYFI